MKTNFVKIIALFMLLNLNQAFSAPAATTTRQHDPEIKVVVSQKRIWLITDEISVKNLTVQVVNEQGKTVMEKQFSSKTSDWSLRIETLPAGKYSVLIGSKKMTEFKR